MESMKVSDDLIPKKIRKYQFVKQIPSQSDFISCVYQDESSQLFNIKLMEQDIWKDSPLISEETFDHLRTLQDYVTQLKHFKEKGFTLKDKVVSQRYFFIVLTHMEYSLQVAYEMSNPQSREQTLPEKGKQMIDIMMQLHATKFIHTNIRLSSFLYSEEKIYLDEIWLCEPYNKDKPLQITQNEPSNYQYQKLIDSRLSNLISVVICALELLEGSLPWAGQVTSENILNAQNALSVDKFTGQAQQNLVKLFKFLTNTKFGADFSKVYPYLSRKMGNLTGDIGDLSLADMNKMSEEKQVEDQPDQGQNNISANADKKRGIPVSNISLSGPVSNLSQGRNIKNLSANRGFDSIRNIQQVAQMDGEAEFLQVKLRTLDTEVFKEQDQIQIQENKSQLKANLSSYQSTHLKSNFSKSLDLQQNLPMLKLDKKPSKNQQILLQSVIKNPKQQNKLTQKNEVFVRSFFKKNDETDSEEEKKQLGNIPANKKQYKFSLPIDAISRQAWIYQAIQQNNDVTLSSLKLEENEIKAVKAVVYKEGENNPLHTLDLTKSPSNRHLFQGSLWLEKGHKYDYYFELSARGKTFYFIKASYYDKNPKAIDSYKIDFKS
ncbi:UNKNOWN [Stylonychia lemnae]|uniref:Protein kinase domain-containing protein n=1 Tax=Stylonychia lemnae TaxID=5949 RepID=A0A078A9A7_STYLE|nr:UNKNOWN [Stylonychia lemnae]|eukprot:CDW78162.1 UNKNOWN [Stylonychia lemnae]